MRHVLVIESSAMVRSRSTSSMLAERLVLRILSAHPGCSVTRRNLSETPAAQFSQTLLRGVELAPDKRDAAEQAAVGASDRLIAELVRADLIVIACPMYGLSIPSALKAWLEQVCIQGKTFRYDEHGGVVGLLSGRKVFAILTRGAPAPPPPAAPPEFQESYLRAVLPTIGLDDITTVVADGLSMGPEQNSARLAAAGRAIDAVAID